MSTLTSTFLTDHGPVAVRGAYELERTAHGLLPHRLPAAARAQFPDDYLTAVDAQPAGVRLAFRTAAAVIELETLPTKAVYPEGADPDGVYDLVIDGRTVRQAVVRAGNTVTMDAAGGSEFTAGPPGRARFTGLGDEVKEVEIWLPQAERTELVALHTDAPVHPPTPTGRPVWLHHGSSISHGADADSPTGTWPVVAAALAGVEVVNLGLSGNALLDPFTARAIRDAPADLISLKLGINLVNTDLFRLRALGPAVHGFLDTVREGHPRTPLLVVSPVLCPAVEDAPGPTVVDPDSPTKRFVTLGVPADVATGRLSLNVIRRELARITAERSADDPHLHYLDGRELYGARDHERLPLPDGLHPDTAGLRLIGERFARLAFDPGGPFAADRAGGPVT
ncbi:GDSL-type esterase/lipase family protein [Kitasatospora sp. NPDC057015]|uniref:GDSL-type esterase/lipase family protein n=1 Tax=Kitasatospora sp. NPDC057015 TaxID=3346001 RepID=UPI003625246A